jgi:phosphosulfolactate phosphohydrolase-like enzyme
MATIRVGLNGNKHSEHVHDLVGAAERLGIKPGYYDASENCVYLDLPDGATQEWMTGEDVVVTLPNGSERR